MIPPEFILILAVIFAFVGGFVLRGTRTGGSEQSAGQPDSPTTAGDGTESIYAVAARLETALMNAAHPRDVLDDQDFKTGVARLEQCSEKELVQYALGNNWVIACLAAEALTQRELSTEAVDKLIGQLSSTGLWVIYFVLRALAKIRGRPLVGPVLAQAQEWWKENPLAAEVLGEFVAARREAEPQLTFAEALNERSSEDVELIESVIGQLDPTAVAPLREEIANWRLGHADLAFLHSLGRFYTDEELRHLPYETERFVDDLARMGESLGREPPQSVLLVGEPGVGKTALRRAFAAELRAAGWMILETNAAFIIAGKKYIGEIEDQVKGLRKNLQTSKRIVLFIDRLNELQTAGRTIQNPVGVLDQLWPAIERRELFMVSEVTPQGYQLLLHAHPGLATVLNVVHVEAAEEAESLELAELLLADIAPNAAQTARAELARESLHLARQYLTYKAAPGRVLGLLGVTIKRLADRGEQHIRREDLLATIAQLTGLPEDVLDEDQQLDLAGLEARFKREVIGQDEAVACLVERIAMLKAGLTDATRPIGVFLFAGPTGTGKTEIAKTLAEILFGAPERMIRLDMSEFQAADSIERMLADTGESGDAQTLVHQIRNQPFSVVLLDEFEKAHARVWDIFLQVFDDGRLTDARGSLADFRHCIIILTSNLGATVGTGAGIGFTSTSGHFAPSEVTRAIERTFRKEFINRLDRVVVFQPLSRQVMRRILRKELERVLQRRGFRAREWAVEWEDSALEFLLDRGFTPDLGARPLRRAIDRYVLAPLSFTIVEHQFPEGEQFLFVRSDGERIQVEFVDPDVEAAPAVDEALGAPGSLGSIVMEARGGAEERQLLRAHAEPLLMRLGGEPWEHEKQSLIETMNDSDFWSSNDRYGVLDRIEHMDRIEAAAAGLRSLLERLERSPGSRQLCAEIAEKLYLLETACADLDEGRPTQAFLELRARPDGDGASARAFLQRLTNMYERWARKRRMKWRVLATTDDAEQLTRLFAVAGFGAYTILAPEHGLHVFEKPRDKIAFERIRVRVRVAPQPPMPAGSKERWLTQAYEALAAVRDNSEIVRRYQEQPSPLVRDKVSGWRTGRLDRVLDGDFDLFQKAVGANWPR